MPRRNPAPAAPTAPATSRASVGPTPEAIAAVEAFKQAKAEFDALELFISSGKFIIDIFATCGGDIEKAQTQFQELWNRARSVTEDYNAKLRVAKDALRQIVQLAPTQWRGPDGSPDVVTIDDFRASSMTKRGYDAETLFKLVQEKGLLERLLELSGTDKDGKTYKLVEQQWKIDYEGVKNWLRANNMDDVLNGSYDESEMTPQCRGPKELYFFGDKKKD